jgi:hypothetical protein
MQPQSDGIEGVLGRFHGDGIKAESTGQVMEKFTTILAVFMLSLAAVNQPAAAGCLQDAAALAARARADQDWLRRETVMALVTEARRDAVRGREAACASTLDRARAQSRAAPQ